MVSISLAPGTHGEYQLSLQAWIRWSFPKITEGMSIVVKAESDIKSKLWAEVDNEGEVTTGLWLAKGTQFTFKKTITVRLQIIIYDCGID